MSQPKNLLDNGMNDIDLRFTKIQLYLEVTRNPKFDDVRSDLN